MTNAAKQVQFITPDTYPQMMNPADAARALKVLRASTTAVKARVAMEAAAVPMRAAILQYVIEMEEAGTDMGLVYEKVHEIRGFAETAELASTGRIADVLCRYMDDMVRIGRAADATIIALHVSAIARAARAEDDDVRMGEIVAAELAGLVARKLLEAGRHSQA